MRNSCYVQALRTLSPLGGLGEAAFIAALNQRSVAEMVDYRDILPKVPIFTFFVQEAGGQLPIYQCTAKLPR